MGKKRYDSYSDMSSGGGNRFAKPKGNPLVHTKNRVHSEGTYSGAGKAMVKESRLNAGGSRYFMGKRRAPKMKASGGNSMPYK